MLLSDETSTREQQASTSSTSPLPSTSPPDAVRNAQWQQRRRADVAYVHPLDKAYPLTHFIGHRPRTVREELKEGEEGFSQVHRRFDHFASLSWADPLRARRRGKEVRQEERGTRGEDRGDEEEDEGEEEEEEEAWRAKMGWLLWSRLKEMVHSTLASFAILTFVALIARSRYWTEYSSPIILGAFGTETVIVFCLYQIPSAQPLAIVLGNTVSTIVAVAVSRAFFHYASYQPGSVGGVNWAAPVVAVITSSGLMQLLGIIHPPGAAISVLATTTPNVVGVGWDLCAHVLLISLLFVAWALIVNNVGGRRWPNSWGAPFYPTAPTLGEARRHFARKRGARRSFV